MVFQGMPMRLREQIGVYILLGNPPSGHPMENRPVTHCLACLPISINAHLVRRKRENLLVLKGLNLPKAV